MKSKHGSNQMQMRVIVSSRYMIRETQSLYAHMRVKLMYRDEESRTIDREIRGMNKARSAEQRERDELHGYYD